MSMLADVKRVAQNLYENTALNEEESAEVFLDILGAIEWSFNDVAYDLGIKYEEGEEVEAARKYLFGD